MSEEAARLLAQAIEDAEQRLVTHSVTGLYFPTVAQEKEGEKMSHYDD